jgi:uncharacterized protein YkwD
LFNGGKQLKKTLKNISTALALVLVLTALPSPSFAAVSDEKDATAETTEAVLRLAKLGIYIGRGAEDNDFSLNAPLTRAELAVILTRLDVSGKSLNETSVKALRGEPFNDVPEWALGYVAYCRLFGYLDGVSANMFNPQGKVSVKTLCVAILRSCGVSGISLENALAPGEDENGAITRGRAALLIARGIDGRDAAPVNTEQSLSQTSEFDELKAEVVRLTNEERAKEGLPALEVLPELMDCAQAKAQDLIDNDYYAHTSPTYGSVRDMMAVFVPDSDLAGENLCNFGESAERVMEAWLGSAGHLANIVYPKFTHVGIGLAESDEGKPMWVQQFVRLKQ